ncbi:membrane protein insertase YidC [uncultured Acetatifactor sp.]|uniref:membrane protein insertase YidC n=1 Tax=uncultured Acetatifactor sp. TaxID=1671927 RepID=UPI0026153E54|nr:membrane protein insertase YidC [uncultured Acetatifactor sp.]
MASGSNYIIAMILFTLLTKILLLPIGIWTQKNGIKMVQMRPYLNLIKVKHFGDKDTIADETAALYKAKKYHPLLGTLPLIIQIIILLGIIDVVKIPEYAGLTAADMLVGKIDFALYPYQAGGLYWCMPLLAGLSSFILSIAQNRMNPLQAEQGRWGQLGTMAMSVGISLALGAYVLAGVGAYWISSNLLAILQQSVLNLIINPRKHIDQKLLEESRLKLEELENVGADGKKARHDPNAAREKADYKRFFSVANKHLVFYSENNGFYKYFENIIEYLLDHSNVTIHYITSDPRDSIFEKAEGNSRIRGYYIGEKKLITLMMKMDADMVVMTMSDLENYHIKRSYVRKDIEYVYLFHYPLSTHMVLHTGALDHYDTILCVGEFQIPEIRKQEELYHLPEKKLIMCGYGQLEKLQKQYDAMEPPVRTCRKILVAPSWQEDNILDSCIDDLLRELMGKGNHIVVRPHPEYVKRYGKRMENVVSRYADYTGDDLEFELDFTSNTSIFDSDLVVTDWSGTAFEFSFVTGKPAVFINTPMKVNNPDYEKLGIEPQEIRLRDKVGISLDTEDIIGCNGRIQQLMEHQEEYIRKNLALRDTLIANYGHSGEIGGKYIIDSLQRRIEARKAAQGK